MNNRRAALWMIGAIISFTSMAVAGRAISGQLDTFEIMLYRSIMGFGIVLAVAKSVGTLSEIDLKHFRLHLLRNIFHFTGQNLWFFALPLIPLAQLFALEFTSPIWVLLLAPFFLGEGLTLRKIAIAALGFIGVLIVARPEIGAVNIGIIAATCAAIGFAGAAILTRKLTVQNSLTKILFFLTGLQIIFGLLCAGYDGDIALPSVAAAPWLILIGAAGLAAHFCMTKSLSLAPASLVMPVDFARLPLIAVIGVVFYGESLDFYLVLGAALILAANYLNLKRQA
ncbi:DMT family transporter [Planktomarina sp.]|jgi:drug/metabolite transporter (DMT)-like permease|nr:DMT family transporter [Planktomarina sp.]MDB4841031.1 DMT family transporter [Planktomarina sp.]